MLIHKPESADKDSIKHIRFFLKLEGRAIADVSLMS